MHRAIVISQLNLNLLIYKVNAAKPTFQRVLWNLREILYIKCLDSKAWAELNYCNTVISKSIDMSSVTFFLSMMTEGKGLDALQGEQRLSPSPEYSWPLLQNKVKWRRGSPQTSQTFTPEYTSESNVLFLLFPFKSGKL